MVAANTDFGVVANDLTRAAASFALLTSSATAFGSALGAFRQFERQLVLTNAIAGGTVEQFDRMKEAARSFSLVTTTSAVEAGQALQQLAQAGFTAEESLDAMNGVLLLSQATLTDVAVAADTLSSNIRAFGLEAGDTTRVANVFTATITGSLATMEKLAFAFRQVAPVAELAGLSIEETSAALGVLFNVGLRGEQAGTALRNIIIRLVRPLGEANDLLEGAGIATRKATGDLRNLADILRDIAASDLSDADLARIFETEALAGVKAFIKALEDVDSTGDDAFTRLLKNVTGTDRALEIAAQNLDTFDGAMRLFQNNLTDLGITIGEQLAEPIRFLADKMREMIDTFRALDPETQALITKVAALGAAALVSLAAVNALALLFGGPLTRAIGLVIRAIIPWRLAMTAATVSTTAFTGSIAAMAGALRAGGIAGLIGGIITAARALPAAFAIFIASNPITIGIAAITAGVAALAGAIYLLGEDARQAQRELDALFLKEYATARQDTGAIVDSILPEGAVTEVQSRINQLNNQLSRIGSVGGPSDIVGTSNRKISEVAVLQEQIQTTTDQLEEEFAHVRELDVRGQQLIDEYKAAVGQFEEGSPELNSAIEQLNAFVEGLNVQDRAALDELRGAREVNERQINELADIAGGLFQAQDRAISTLLGDLARGNASVPDDLRIAAELLAGNLDTTPAFTAALKEQIANRTANGGDLLLVTLEEGLRSLGIPIEKIVPLLVTEQERNNSALINALSQLITDNSSIGNDAYSIILENQLNTAKTIEEATRLATELANIELEEGLIDVAEDLRDNYDATLSQFGELKTAAVQEAFDNLVANEEGIDSATLTAVVSGQAILDAINEEISADSTPEEINAIIDEQFELYAQLMADFVNALAEAGTLSPEQIGIVQAAFAASADAAKQAALAGLGSATASVASEVKSATSRINRGSRKGGGGGKSAADKARDEARKIEDAFADAERQALKARDTFVKNAEGLSVVARIDFSLENDLEKINQDADRQITRLKRKLEDLASDGINNEALNNQIKETIALIEASRQAEIDAATSFEASMARRSDALDLFIRDLETLAFESQNTFTKISAGIGKAFAEYNKDLVTLVDITSNAVTGFLDGISSGVADFIFDNENAWENFKATMLDISRDIFEGFTKALLQQTISSLTDGGGSIFGNLLQPGSLFGGENNNEAPSVGSGGLLGGLFGGAQGGQQGQISAQPIQQGVTQIATALQNGATQIQTALQSVSTQAQTGGAQVGNGLRTASVQTQQGGQQVGQSLQQAGQTIGTAAGQAASSIQAGAAGGSVGGGGNFLTSLLGFGLSFLKDGGMVGDRTVNNFVRNYAEGGNVVGPGGPRSDDVFAMLSNGEFVVNAKATSEFGPLLEAINSGALKGDTASAVLNSFTKGGGSNQRFDTGFKDGGLVGDTSFGPPSVNLTEPRAVLIDSAARSNNNTVNNNQRAGDKTINLRIVQNVSGNQSAGDQRRSADQLAKRIANQIERAGKNA